MIRARVRLPIMNSPNFALGITGRVQNIRLAPARDSKGFCTLNIEDQMVIYALQQRPLNGSLNLEDATGFSIYRVSLNYTLSI
jgi:hypothetical protein